jgi:hypothetical protein
MAQKRQAKKGSIIGHDGKTMSYLEILPDVPLILRNIQVPPLLTFCYKTAQKRQKTPKTGKNQPKWQKNVLPGNFARCSLNLEEYPGSTSSNILLQMLSNLSWQLRSLLTRLAHLSGSFLPSNESNS